MAFLYIPVQVLFFLLLCDNYTVPGCTRNLILVIEIARIKNYCLLNNLRNTIGETSFNCTKKYCIVHISKIIAPWS